MSAREARVGRRLLGVAAIVLAVVAGAAPAQGQGRAFSIDRFAGSITDNVRRIWLGLGLGILAAAAIVYALPPSWAGYRSGALALGLALSGLVIAMFSPLMPRKTWDGARAMVRVQGFRELLERAEKDRLERMPADTLHR